MRYVSDHREQNLLHHHRIDIRRIQIYRESVLVKPVNTPITPLCSEYRHWENITGQFVLTLESQPASPP